MLSFIRAFRAHAWAQLNLTTWGTVIREVVSLVIGFIVLSAALSPNIVLHNLHFMLLGWAGAHLTKSLRDFYQKNRPSLWVTAGVRSPRYHNEEQASLLLIGLIFVSIFVGLIFGGDIRISAMIFAGVVILMEVGLQTLWYVFEDVETA